MKSIIQAGLFLVLALSSSGVSGVCELSECSTNEGCPLKRNNLLTTLPTLNKEFFVSLEFKATAWQSGFQNVIHFTQDGDCCDVGERIPGLWVLNDGQLYPCSAVNGNGDFCITTTKKYPLNQWIKVQFSQTLENGKYIYRVLIDGKNEIEVVNSQPKAFSNVKVYAAENWRNSVKGSIRNLDVNADSSKPCGAGGAISGCDCSDHLEDNHLGGKIGACLTTLKAKFWCYIRDNGNSKCPDKKPSSRGTPSGKLWWSFVACKTYTEFQPNTGK